MLDRSTLRVLNLVNQADLATLRASLEDWGIQAYFLDGSQIRDTESFFQQAAQDIPMPQGRTAHTGWSAFKDNLWESLHFVEADKLAIVWTDAQRMLDGSLADLLAAMDAMLGLSRQFYSPQSANSQPKTIYLFLVGEGKNFPRAEMAPR